MISLDVKVEGTEQVIQFTGRLAARIRNPKPLLKKMAIYMQGSIDKNFREGGRPEKWKPLSALTQKLRRGKGKGKPLQDTGALRKSITYEISRDEAKIFPTVFYAKYQQLGFTVSISEKFRRWLHWRGIHLRKETETFTVPPRPFMVIQHEDIDRLAAMAERYLVMEARAR